MTALTDREFHDELALYATDYAPFVPPAYASGECDACGEDTQVRVTDDGLACQDCYDAAPVWDPRDPDERQDDGWGWE